MRTLFTAGPVAVFAVAVLIRALIRLAAGLALLGAVLAIFAVVIYTTHPFTGGALR